MFWDSWIVVLRERQILEFASVKNLEEGFVMKFEFEVHSFYVTEEAVILVDEQGFLRFFLRDHES